MTKADIENHKQFIKLWRKLRKSGLSLKSPTHDEFVDVKNMVQSLKGNLEADYISKILMAYIFAISHSHAATGITLYDNVISGKRIFLNSYRKNE